MISKLIATAMLIVVLGGVNSSDSLAADHVWSDATSNFQTEGELLARNESSIILQLKDNSLLLVGINQLCDADKSYIVDLEAKREAVRADKKSPFAGQTAETPDSEVQTWDLVNGHKIYGSVQEYGRRLVQVRTRGSKVYVNDRSFKNLPEFYQKLVPEIVNHFEDTKISDEKELRKWLRKQKGHEKHFTVEGVLLEFYNGDLFGVPFFLFSADDLKVLKPGWKTWLQADEDAKYHAELALRLRAETIARRRNKSETLQLQRLHVQLTAYDAGMFDLWRVIMSPPVNQRGVPVQVIVPGRDSAQAASAAREAYPAYRVGPIAKVIR